MDLTHSGASRSSKKIDVAGLTFWLNGPHHFFPATHRMMGPIETNLAFPTLMEVTPNRVGGRTSRPRVRLFHFSLKPMRMVIDLLVIIYPRLRHFRRLCNGLKTPKPDVSIRTLEQRPQAVSMGEEIPWPMMGSLVVPKRALRSRGLC